MNEYITYIYLYYLINYINVEYYTLDLDLD